MTTYIVAKVSFEHPDPDLAADLIADIFHSFGLQGVVIEAPHDGQGVDWADGAHRMPTQNAVTGYLVKDDRSTQYRLFLEERLAVLRIDV